MGDRVAWRVVVREEGSISLTHSTEVVAFTLEVAFAKALAWWTGLAAENEVGSIGCIELWRRGDPTDFEPLRFRGGSAN